MKKPAIIITDPRELYKIAMNQPRVSRERAAYSINIQNGIKLPVGKRLDMVYDQADDLMRENKLDLLVEILDKENPDKDEDAITVAIGWLTATLPVKKKTFAVRLARWKLKKRIKNLLLKQGRENWRSVLSGL